MIVKTRIVGLVWAGAITVWPFIFVHPKRAGDRILLKHEGVHAQQQRKWAIYGCGVGLLAWFMLYLLCLPVGWNPFRYNAEKEAMREAEGYGYEFIRMRLKEPPWHLWWH